MPKPSKNPGIIAYKSTIFQSDQAVNSWAWVEFPYDLKELYGIGNLVPVIATYDGISYRGSISKMGGPPMLLIKRDILASLGKKRGDEIEVSVTLDDKPREVEIPQELKKQFQENLQAKAVYDKLAYSHRKEFARWISEAKQTDTRNRRALKAISMIMDKKNLN